MIIYFADRQLNIIGQASTELPNGLTITDDLKTEDIETGVAVFECKIPFDKNTRALAETCTEVGNHVLRSHNGENEFYTIIDVEIDTKKQEVLIYAEDDGMDLLNEVVGAYEADKAYPITHYIEKYASGAGFVVGINQAEGLTRQLSWDGESTATERIASIATQFDGCEVSYSFDVDGLTVSKKYINIYKERGKDVGVQLRLNRDIDSIVTTKSIANLATALQCTGGTIDRAPILEATSSGTPKVTYTVELKTESRTENTAQITASITSSLTSEDAKLGKGYGLKASVYIGGSWRSATIKSTDKDNATEWSGIGNHITDYTFTVSNVPAGVATYTDIKFKVDRTDSNGGSAGVLASTACGKFSVPNYIKGGENGEDINSRPITIEGYEYDDGDFYVEGNALKSRVALQNWARAIWKTDESQKSGGHITKLYTYETDSQQTLCQRAITELKTLRDVEVNYKVETPKLPDNVKIGDRVNIVDDAGELYVSARILKLETSVVDDEHQATIGEYLIKSSGIAQKVADLAEKFAKTSASAKRAYQIATNAKSSADNARNIANTAATDAINAQILSEEAQAAATAAQNSANTAQQAAESAESAVGVVEESVAGLEITVANAQQAASQAQQAAQTAETKASEARQAAVNAQAKAEEAATAAGTAQTKAESAMSKAESVETSAEQAIAEAQAAATTAAAAKLDAENAQKDIDALGENLTTLSNTMSADYARKTDLTDATASLQTQISQNAAEISSTASRVQTIDETVNNAAELAANAQTAAQAAQTQADQATADAQAAQTAADTAAQAAQAAQSEADTAKAAAETAKSVADKAESDLAKAQADLATVSSRVDSTEDEIAAAQQAVTTAQAAADKAKQDAEAAAGKATAAQSTADTAVTNAATAQAAANEASSKAALAQQTADSAKGDAAAAQSKANEAATAAAEAQNTANTAKTNAANAQAKADQALADAVSAQQAANAADAKAAQAATDLATAQQNLANVTSRVDATEEEVEAAQAAVATAQAAADKAKQDAATAQSTADTAKANATTAQTAANNAKSAADKAQSDATAAQQAADKAQTDVNNLAVRVTTAETNISQNSEQIALRATKTEVAQTLGGYYTKTETDAALNVKANEISSSVSATYATKQSVADIEVGGCNLLRDSKGEFVSTTDSSYGHWFLASTTYSHGIEMVVGQPYTLSFDWSVDWGGITPSNYVYASVGCGATAGQFSHDVSQTPSLTSQGQTSGKAVLTFIPTETQLDGRPYFSMRPIRVNTENALDGSVWTIKNLKLEKGNKATDWTPAPEDADEKLSAVANELTTTIEAQKTEIVETARGITASALEEYVKTDEYDTFKGATQSTLELLPGQLALKFSTEEAKLLEDGLQELRDPINKFFTFTENGITISCGENTMKLRLDNDFIGFYNGEIDETDLTKNRFGWWDGVDFHTGNIVVETHERAQFGNFAFMPRSDGSLSFLKVGD